MRRPLGRELTADLAVTALLCVFWVWFGWQYGFRNTPDSWYRGILASSIVEGHPFSVSVKQSYLYEFGPELHPDAQHPPFIPLLLAACFAVFGKRIVFANLISCLSAGLLYLPLARLSRALGGSRLVAFLVYLFPVGIESSGFLFETTGGLSIPTATLLLLSSLAACLLVWRSRGLRPAFCAGFLLGCAGLTRTDAQNAGLAWLAASLAIALVLWRRRDAAAARRIAAFAATGLLVLSPWLLRNAALFGNPFFTHPSLAAWTESGSELYEYHESQPLPSAALYFSRHSPVDFAGKLLSGLRATWRIYSHDIVPLRFWLPAFLVSLGFLCRRHARHGAQLFLLAGIAATLAGYLLTFALAAGAFLDDRFSIPLLFLGALVCFSATVAAAESAAERFWPGSRRARLAWRLSALCLLAVVTLHAQRGLWAGRYKAYLLHLYTDQDALASRDPTILALAKLPRDAVVLTPFAQTQRIAFLTGLAAIEEPVNLRSLRDPLLFFRRYGIRYSLVDVLGVLPRRNVDRVSLAGNAALFEIDLEGTSQQPRARAAPLAGAAAGAIRRGKRSRAVFVDAHHGGCEPGFESLLAGLDTDVFVSRRSFVAEEKRLMQSGLLVLSYRMRGARLEPREWTALLGFVDSGGSVLLLCPVWVWLDYEQQMLGDSPCNRVAGLYGTLIVPDYPQGRLRLAGPPLLFDSRVEVRDWWGAFSKVVSTNAHAQPLLLDEQRAAFGTAVALGDSRAIVVGHNFVAQPDAYRRQPELLELLRKWLDWLLQPSVA